MAKEIHEDQPLVEPGAAWIKQLWLPLVWRMDVLNRPIYPAYIVNADVAYGTRMVPSDFNSISTFDLVLRSTTTNPHTIPVTVRFGKCGELWNVHNANANLNVNLVINVYYCYDLLADFAALLANLEADDILWVQVGNTLSQPFYAHGIDMRYT